MPSLKSDFFRPELLGEAIEGAFAGMTALWGTGVAAIDGTLGAARKGEKVQMPYFGNLGEMEDALDDESDYNTATISKLTSTMEEATVHHSRKVFEITEWALMSVSYDDPYEEAARQIRELVVRRADKALIDAAATTSLTINAITDPALADTITWDAVVRAKYLFGDELEAQRGIALGVMHSKVAMDAELLKDGDGRPLLINPVDGSLTRIGNIPFAKSDKLEILPVTNPKQYQSLICKPRSMAFWYNSAHAANVQTDKDIIGDSRIAAVHVYWAAHLYNRMPGGTKKGVAKLITQ